MIRVAVSILNFNSSQSTSACVRSLQGTYHETSGKYVLDIFIADNGSDTDKQLQLKQSLAELPNVHLQLNIENHGFAAGHNGNLKSIFRHSQPDYIWILNNDCLVNEETLLSLIKCARQHPDVGIWGATLLEPDGETIQCAGGCFYNSWLSSYRQYGQGKTLAQIDQLKPVNFDYIAGASLFFPVTVLQDGFHPLLGLPTDDILDKQQWLNERFFLYFEELDLVKRLKLGIGIAWCKSAVIKHVGGASIGTSKDQRTAKAEYYSTLSALIYTRLYHPRRLWFMAPVRYLAKCLLLFVKGEFRLIGPLTRAYRDFLSG